MTHTFALVGAAGYIAPRHMRAIRDTGNQLVAAVDPRDSVGVLDSYFPNTRFFTEIERFDRHLEKLRRTQNEQAVEFVSICSPNYLHDAHVRLALRVNAHAICEKPLVINPWNLEQLAELEAEHKRRVYTIMQLRLHPELLALKERLATSPPTKKCDVTLSYISRRGQWYDVSWKGSPEKSGGLGMNLGVHFFDLLLWLFGPAEGVELNLDSPRRMAGVLELERARVRWFLSVRHEDVPAKAREAGQTAWRAMTVDGEGIEFSGGFTDLHTRVYEEILAGRGLGLDAALPSIEVLHRIRTADVSSPGPDSHPFLH